MRKKYIMIFLMGLLYLVSSVDLYSQHCYKLSYDKNGNRIGFMTVGCLSIMRDVAEDTNVVEEKDQKELIDELLVIPNPNNGIFRISTNEEYNGYEVQVYDCKGVLINKCLFDAAKEIDMSSNPSGIYLLRIIGNNDVKSVVVVKH